MRSLPFPGSPPGGPAPRRAAAAVEFAVASIAFFAIVLGIIEMGRVLMVQHLLTNAARQACRYGVLQGKSSTQISTVAVNALAAEGVNGDAATVLVNDGSTDASQANSGDEITVKVTISAGNFSWLPFTRSFLGTVSGQYTLRRE
jgi:Flp pilus assembly protein TadG